MILDNPLIGFTWPAVGEVPILLTGQHVITYRLTPTRIEIPRILPGRMDFKQNL